MTGESIVVEPLGHHPEFSRPAVEMQWEEWGADLPCDEKQRWLDLMEAACNTNGIPTAFVALVNGKLAGVVALHEFDIPSMRDRSPWICGMFVHRDHRGTGIGRKVLSKLESFAADHDIDTVWVFTGEDAVQFYERCGWERYGVAIENSERGNVLSKRCQ
jgi:GNAT superfamily N-acetyltransferase